MARDDWDDPYYDDGDFPVVRRQKGGTSVVVAIVISFIASGLNTLSSSCLTFCGLSFSMMAGPQANNIRAITENAGVIFLAMGLGSGLAFVLQLVAAIGLVNRRVWGRTLSYWTIGLCTVLSVVLGYHVVTGMLGGGGEEKFLVLGPIGYSLAVHLFYIVLVLPALLTKSADRALS